MRQRRCIPGPQGAGGSSTLATQTGITKTNVSGSSLTATNTLSGPQGANEFTTATAIPVTPDSATNVVVITGSAMVKKLTNAGDILLRIRDELGNVIGSMNWAGFGSNGQGNAYVLAVTTNVPKILKTYRLTCQAAPTSGCYGNGVISVVVINQS